MLLKNYFQLLSDISQLYPDSQAITFSTPIKNLVGTTLTLKYDPYTNIQSIPTTLPNTFSNCIIGSSDAPSNFDDYCLKSQITNFSASLITTISSEIKDGHERFTILIFGKVTEACIVREIGLTKKNRHFIKWDTGVFNVATRSWYPNRITSWRQLGYSNFLWSLIIKRRNGVWV